MNKIKPIKPEPGKVLNRYQNMIAIIPSVGMEVNDVLRDMVTCSIQEGKPIAVKINKVNLACYPGMRFHDLRDLYDVRSDGNLSACNTDLKERLQRALRSNEELRCQRETSERECIELSNEIKRLAAIRDQAVGEREAVRVVLKKYRRLLRRAYAVFIEGNGSDKLWSKEIEDLFPTATATVGHPEGK